MTLPTIIVLAVVYGVVAVLGLASVAPAPTYEGLYSGEWEHPAAAGPWELVGE